ncbi:MAG: hypothetical protein GAK37_03688 [Pseudomonas sp.]|nr:MAG: hypothetical protein GAK37_03688 [Pseudomonas sp.]
MQDVGGNVQRTGAVPVCRLAGHQLNVGCRLEHPGGAVAAGVTGGVAGLAFDDGDFAALRAQLVDDELPAFGTHCMVVGGQEGDDAALGGFELRQVDFLVEVDDVDAFFVRGSDGLDQADGSDRRNGNRFVVLVDSVFEQALLALDIVFAVGGKDVHLHPLFLGFLLDTVAHGAPVRVGEGLQDHRIVSGVGLLHGAKSEHRTAGKYSGKGSKFHDLSPVPVGTLLLLERRRKNQ